MAQIDNKEKYCKTLDLSCPAITSRTYIVEGREVGKLRCCIDIVPQAEVGAEHLHFQNRWVNENLKKNQMKKN